MKTETGGNILLPPVFFDNIAGVCYNNNRTGKKEGLLWVKDGTGNEAWHDCGFVSPHRDPSVQTCNDRIVVSM